MSSMRQMCRVTFWLWLLMGALLAGAFFAQAAWAASREVTGAEQGQRFRMRVGDMLELRLQSNPSTGYMWRVHPQSTPLLKLTDQSQSRDNEGSGAEPRVGQPLFQIFKFAAQRRGRGVLLLHYVRSWEKPAPDEKQFRLYVAIE